MTEPVVHWFGATVAGPRHQRAERKNEDAWLGVRRAFGTAIVVCDGVGSCADARTGARAACQAVIEATSRWWRARQASPTQLIRLIHVLWELRISPHPPSRCATTCLFALLLADGRVIVAQLGDGLVVIRHADGHVDALVPDDGGFTNITPALGGTRSLADWRILTAAGAPGLAVLLASDGVADDLDPKRHGPLVESLVERYAPLEPARRRAGLRGELLNWQTPGHGDDKTLALLWLPAVQGQLPSQESA